jgi:hypothetical protein
MHTQNTALTFICKVGTKASEGIHTVENYPKRSPWGCHGRLAFASVWPSAPFFPYLCPFWTPNQNMLPHWSPHPHNLQEYHIQSRKNDICCCKSELSIKNSLILQARISTVLQLTINAPHICFHRLICILHL